MMICLSIAPRFTAEAIRRIHSERFTPDPIEVRVDGIRNLNLAKILRSHRTPVIITNRRVSEGGSFTGDAIEQVTILTEALRLGADYIDCELSWGKTMIRELKTRAGRTKIIASYHNFQETPGNLGKLYQRLRSTGADIVKLAVMASDITDNVRLFEVCKMARTDRQPIIIIGMGEYGEISRILAGKIGATMTFASRTTATSTGPGQRTRDELKSVFRAHMLNRRTKIFGLLGNPVKQSRGIYVHNAIFERKQLNAVYVNFLLDDLDSFFTSLDDMVTGCSITMPFKESVVNFLEHLDPQIADLRVVNTIIKRRNGWTGYNTDMPAMRELLRARIQLRGSRVLVIGTGGTARTMAYTVLMSGAEATIVGRSSAKARDLARSLGCSWARNGDLPSLGCDVLMNATPLGMNSIRGGPELATMPVPGNFFRRRMLVFDAVYTPSHTPLIRAARQRGCTTITGDIFFERQAVLQSKLFMSCFR